MVLTIPPEGLPLQECRARFLLAGGERVADGMLSVRGPGGGRPVTGGEIALPAVRAGGKREPLRVVFTGDVPLALDRVVVHGRLSWRLALEE